MSQHAAAEAWVPWVKFGGAGIVAATTIAVSAVWLVQLAELCGMHGLLAWSLPIALDVGGGVATVIWVKSAGEAATWGQVISIGALAASLVGNTLSHLIKAGIVHVNAWLIIGVGAVYPVMFFLVIHLLVVSGAQAKARKVAVPARTAVVRQPVPAPEVASVTQPAAPKPAAASVNPSPETAASTKTVAPKPLAPVATNVRELHPHPAPSKREQGEAWFRHQVLVEGRGADEITAAEVDKAIDATQYSKKHIQSWRDAVAAELTTAANDR